MDVWSNKNKIRNKCVRVSSLKVTPVVENLKGDRMYWWIYYEERGNACMSKYNEYEC